MLKEYSMSFIKNNKASSISIMIAALISSMFLSLICCLFYNMWTYDVKQVIYEEGDWQGALVGKFDDEDLTIIKNHANVNNVIVDDKSLDGVIVVKIYFSNLRQIYDDLPQIAQHLGRAPSDIIYHDALLSQYLIFDPGQDQHPLLLRFYLLVLGITSLSLMMIIRNAFEFSMGARIHQFGILSSVGATPGQIRICLLQEAAILCILPIFIGSFIGIGLCYGYLQFADTIAPDVQRMQVVFQYHIGIWLITILVSCITVLLSVWFPARKMSKLTPLETVFTVSEEPVTRKKRSQILSALFGIEGELAGISIKARKKALRTTTMSLTLSFLAFSMFLCFITLSTISTKYTYFERYQNTWDIMAEIKDTPITDVDDINQLSNISNIEDAALYQIVKLYTTITEEQISNELMKLGGLLAVAGASVQKKEASYLVSMPMVIMDDESFQEYCKQIGVEEQSTGGILINQIWDSINTNFRYREYVPYINENSQNTVVVNNLKQEILAEVPIIGYTTVEPLLREEYDDYVLVQVLPLSVWATISDNIGFNTGITDQNTYLRILTTDESMIDATMDEVEKALERNYKIEIENRVQQKSTSMNIIKGYKIIVGSLCMILAVIGISNIFSVSLGFIHQRKREFARYSSIGVTPEGIRKMLIIEAATIAGRPLIITLPLTIAFVIYATKASYLNLTEFTSQAPILPITLFMLMIIIFVGLAYYIGGRKICSCSLSEVLKDDTML